MCGGIYNFAEIGGIYNVHHWLRGNGRPCTNAAPRRPAFTTGRRRLHVFIVNFLSILQESCRPEQFGKRARLWESGPRVDNALITLCSEYDGNCDFTIVVIVIIIIANPTTIIIITISVIAITISIINIIIASLVIF